MTVFGAVFARAGSKGVPGKNLREVGGIPLVGRAVLIGVSSPLIDRMLCSTESVQIAEVAQNFGAEVPFLRPVTLAEDQSPEWEAWKHLADFLVSNGASESDVLVSLPATSPLRTQKDVDDAIVELGTSQFDIVVGVSEATRNPWFNMATREATGLTSLACHSERGPIHRRQDAPVVFDMTTVVYATTLGFVLREDGIFSGRVGSVVIPRERSIDVDTELDLEIANLLLKKKGV